MNQTAETPEFVAGAGLLGPHEDIPHPSEESPPEAQETALLSDSEGSGDVD